MNQDGIEGLRLYAAVIYYEVSRYVTLADYDDDKTHFIADLYALAAVGDSNIGRKGITDPDELRVMCDEWQHILDKEQ